MRRDGNTLVLENEDDFVLHKVLTYVIEKLNNRIEEDNGNSDLSFEFYIMGRVEEMLTVLNVLQEDDQK